MFCFYFYFWFITLPVTLVIYILGRRYFKSDVFLKYKEQLQETIDEYNEIASYANQIPSTTEFKPDETHLEHSDLAKFVNTSKHNYSRDKNKRAHLNDNVYATSLQVVKRASEEPIKYLCKYFNIGAKKENILKLQEIEDNISKIENAKVNLEERQKQLEENLNPPFYIKWFFKKRLLKEIGLEVPVINIEYAKYIFEYVSAGGNSSQKTVIELNIPTLEALSAYLVDKIKFKESVKGQRALMTNKLRTYIKERDSYTCQNCGVSTAEQSLLLLEVDHIIPVSKGGLSTEENLQTLCWKCNRSKSDKII